MSIELKKLNSGEFALWSSAPFIVHLLHTKCEEFDSENCRGAGNFESYLDILWEFRNYTSNNKKYVAYLNSIPVERALIRGNLHNNTEQDIIFRGKNGDYIFKIESYMYAIPYHFYKDLKPILFKVDSVSVNNRDRRETNNEKDNSQKSASTTTQ